MKFQSEAMRLLPHGIKNRIQLLLQKSGMSLEKPGNFTFDITDRCQSKCLTCTKWKTPAEFARKELTISDWKTVILIMKKWIGEFHFIFAGGEPLLRTDIFDIINFARTNQIRCSIISNGFGFSHLALQVANCGIDSLRVSLNGNTAKTHDATRGVRGAFRKTVEFIREVNRLRKPLGQKAPKIFLNTILMPFNSEEVIELVKWVCSEGLDGINLQPLDPFGSFHPYSVPGTFFVLPRNMNSNWYRENFEKKARVKIESVICQLINLKQRGFPILNSVGALSRLGKYYAEPDKLNRRKCAIGFQWFNIDPYGFVRFCFDMPPIGNILETPPSKLYYSKESRTTRQLIWNCRKICHWNVCYE